jgi:phosphotransferase system enzyme I (PtsI)
MMKVRGISASPGIAEGSAFIFRALDLSYAESGTFNVEDEIIRLAEAVQSAISELTSLKESVRDRLGDEFAHIFRSQQTIAEDESILAEVEERIRDEGENAETALSDIFGAYISLFAELDDTDYNKTRVADIQDVYKRLLRNLLGIPDINLSDLPSDSIVIAKELFPSETALMDTDKVAGMVTEQGGATSHVAILANNLGIPAAVGAGDVLTHVKNGDIIVLDTTDTDNAEIYVNPESIVMVDLKKRKNKLDEYHTRLRLEGDKPAVTRDGLAVTLSANIGSTAELAPARDAGAKSIGLYRSEFLFMNSPALPSEEEQYAAYRAAAECFSEGFVIIRTLDIGGDKQLPALPLPEEQNPFLGNRALRLTLSRPELFLPQIRAILRSGVHGNVKIMFPMVSGMPELETALDLVDQARAQLEQDGVPFDRSMEIGIMIEIPSAVWVAEALARRVSFFSIGTNDLTQYLLAADRLNSNVSDYYRVFDPSVFRAIEAVVLAAEKHNRWVGVCGELAGNPLAVPLLVGLGVRELSMSPRALAEASWLIRNSDGQELSDLAQSVLCLNKDNEIRAKLREYINSKE